MTSSDTDATAPLGRPHLWRIVLLALVGAALTTSLALYDANRPGQHPARIVHPGADGPSAAVFLRDWPDETLPDGIGHDGQQFYAVARQPMHLEEVAPDLDRPRYRLQRIAFPVLVWALHPAGGGDGLITATVVVGALALLAGGVATGSLAARVGGSPAMALIFPLMPGAYMAMRISAADNLALAAALGAMALSLAGRHRWAVAAGVLAVLAKESLWLLLLGTALWRRDRRGIELAAIPAVAAGTWWVALRLLVEDHSEGVTEFTLPFVGLWDSMQYWLDGNTRFALYVVPLAFVIGIWALVRVGLRHPLGPAIALQLAFLPLLNIDVLGLDANGSRMTMPLTILGAVALQSWFADQRRVTRPRAAPASAP